MADAGAAVEPAQRPLRGSASETANSGNNAASASSDEQADADYARDEWQRQPQSGPGRHQKQPDDAQNPGESRPGALPRDRILGPLQGLRQLKPRDSIRLARGL